MNENNGAPDAVKLKVALKYIIEGGAFETFDQYKQGSELKREAGIPIETELFLSISKPFKDELIENDKLVDLARPGIEYFFVKKKLEFTINKVPFTWYKQYIRGSQIRELGGIDENDSIFLAVEEGYQPELISNEEAVDLARPGKEHFFSKENLVAFSIIVNARPKEWKEKTIFFEQVVILAFGAYDPNPNKGYTVTYSRGVEPKPEGTMVKGSVVKVKNKMIFDVTATDKS